MRGLLRRSFTSLIVSGLRRCFLGFCLCRSVRLRYGRTDACSCVQLPQSRRLRSYSAFLLLQVQVIASRHRAYGFLRPPRRLWAFGRASRSGYRILATATAISKGWIANWPSFASESQIPRQLSSAIPIASDTRYPAAMSNTLVGSVYNTIIEEVVNSSRVDFEESGVEESALELLRVVSLNRVVLYVVVCRLCCCTLLLPEACPAARGRGGDRPG